MSKRRTSYTIGNVQKRLEKGFGQGRGHEYLPFLTIQDVPSQGKCSRDRGWKTNRTHHLLSSLELHYFYMLEWQESVTDIREQFPLLPVEETIAIADALRVKHPRPPGSTEELVLTTDFLITTKGGEFARSVKPAAKLEDHRVIEKLEIERSFWASHGVDWKIVTDRDLPPAFAHNMEWIHPRFHLDQLAPFTPEDVNVIEAFLRPRIGAADRRLRDLTNECDEMLGYEAGAALSAVRHLLAVRRWRTDMMTRILPNNHLILY